jgi:hypothetical protein
MKKKVLKRTALSGKLTQARRPRDDFAHLFRSDFVAAEPEKFARDVLNFGHAQTKRHQLGAERHQPATHQSAETAATAGSGDGGFCARDVVDQDLDFVGGPLVAKETQDDADGFFRDSILYAGFRSQLSYQFVHVPRPNRLLAGSLIVVLS